MANLDFLENLSLFGPLGDLAARAFPLFIGVALFLLIFVFYAYRWGRIEWSAAALGLSVVITLPLLVALSLSWEQSALTIHWPGSEGFYQALGSWPWRRGLTYTGLSWVLGAALILTVSFWGCRSRLAPPAR